MNPNDAKQIISNTLSPIHPLPVTLSPSYHKISGIRCIVFDIYGTLLLSDRSAIPSKKHDEIAYRILTELGIDSPPEGIAARLKTEITEQRLLRSLGGEAHPEIEIRQVWRKVVGFSGQQLSNDEIDKLALYFECATHPVWPVPELKETLIKLKALGFQLGLLSNAQFYTIPIIEAVLKRSIQELGVSASLTLLSYQFGTAKPGEFLFHKLVGQLEHFRIRPEECLYVGNDGDNDIRPAKALGFKTCHAAVDRRSYVTGSTESDLSIQRLADLVGLIQSAE